MMVLLVMIGVTIVSLVLLRLFRGGHPLGKNQGREDFEHGVRTLLLLLKDGGSLQVQQRGAETHLRFVRIGGADPQATVVLRVPRAEWSSGSAHKLHETLVASGYQARVLNDEGSQTLLEVCIPVENIWDRWSGLSSARAAHLLLDQLGISASARFDFTLTGPRSTRMIRQRNQQSKTV